MELDEMNGRMSCWIDDKAVVADVRELRSIWARGLGFMGKKRPPDGHGYLFRKTGSLHTLFMRFDLDVIYLDVDDRVVKVVRGLRPWRLSFGGHRARHALEAPSGTMKLERVKVGDHLELQVFDVGGT